MKVGYIVGGVVLGLFAVAQLLQLFGLIGIGFSVAGIGITILASLGSLLCFQKAFAPPPTRL
jgi:hypothetical protein